MSMRVRCGTYGAKKRMGDAQKDIALIKKVKLGIDPTRVSRLGWACKLPPDPKVALLVEELKKNVGTPAGDELRGQIVEVIKAARKEVATKARAISRRSGSGLKATKGKW